MLLYGKNGIYKFRLKPNRVRVWSKEELEKLDFVISAVPSHEKAEAVLEIDESKYDEATANDALKAAVETAGYKMVG